MGTVPPDGPEVRQLGECLRAARERRGLTLQQVANNTKIPRRHLQALEQGDLSVVTHDFYRRVEVRTFATAVGLDPKIAVARLDEVLSKAAPEAPTPPPPLPFPEVPLGERIQLLPLALLAMMTAAVVVPWTRGTAVQTHTLAVREHPVQLQAAVILPDPAPPEPEPAAEQSSDAAALASNDDIADDKPVAAINRPVLIVTTDPPGSRVVVDGIGRGTTPLEIPYLVPGDHGVRVIRDGFVSEERTVRLGNQPSTELHVELRSASQ